MCLYRISHINIVDSDLTVYKVLSPSHKSPYQYFQYEPNKTYHLGISLKVNGMEVAKGFHAYTSQKDAIEGACIGGLVYPMTIPKGSQVVFGDCNDIVSDSIRTGDMNEEWRVIIENTGKSFVKRLVQRIHGGFNAQQCSNVL